MPEPTRYSTVGDMEADSLGGYIRYTDYAALRKLAEAVVREFNSPGIIECFQAIERLEEYLK